MRAGRFIKHVRIFLILQLIFLPFTLTAADKKDAYIAGKVFDQTQNHPLKDVIVRIVNMDTGVSHQDKTDEDGCYSFKKIPEGTYSLSASYNNQDYLLGEKLKVEKTEHKDIVVASCVALGDKNTLSELQECHLCLKGIPALAILIPAAAAGIGAITAILITDEPPASPSTPQ
ncbi:MAG TPA: carboxypeptidase-like regulatory domain-containing protein [Acidobacteriota bacterium]